MKKRAFSLLVAVVMFVMTAITVSAATTAPTLTSSSLSPAVGGTVTFTINSSNFGIDGKVAASSNLTLSGTVTGATAATDSAFVQVGGPATIVYTYTVNAGAEGQAFWFEASNIQIADETNPPEPASPLRVEGTVAAAASPAVQADISYAAATVTKTVGNGAFTNPLTITAGAAANVTYSSSNTAVATVNAATGEVSIVAAGSATITASHAAVADTWLADAASYTLTVNVASSTPQPAPTPAPTPAPAPAATSTTPNSPQTGVYN